MNKLIKAISLLLCLAIAGNVSAMDKASTSKGAKRGRSAQDPASSAMQQGQKKAAKPNAALMKHYIEWGKKWKHPHYKSLYMAIEQGKVDRVKSILSYSIMELDALIGPVKMNFLHRAAFRGHLDIAKLLIEKGARIDVPMENGKTALAIATERGHVATAAYFEGLYARLHENVEIEESTITEEPHIHVNSISSSCAGIGNLSLHKEVGANALEATVSEEPRIHVNSNPSSSSEAILSVVGHVFAMKPVSPKNPRKFVPAYILGIYNLEHIALYNAILNGEIGTVQSLISKGADVNIAFPNGKTAISLAQENNQLQIVSLLVRKNKKLFKRAQEQLEEEQFNYSSSLEDNDECYYGEGAASTAPARKKRDRKKSTKKSKKITKRIREDEEEHVAEDAQHVPIAGKAPMQVPVAAMQPATFIVAQDEGEMDTGAINITSDHQLEFNGQAIKAPEDVFPFFDSYDWQLDDQLLELDEQAMKAFEDVPQ